MPATRRSTGSATPPSPAPRARSASSPPAATRSSTPATTPTRRRVPDPAHRHIGRPGGDRFLSLSRRQRQGHGTLKPRSCRVAEPAAGHDRAWAPESAPRRGGASRARISPPAPCHFVGHLAEIPVGGHAAPAHHRGSTSSRCRRTTARSASEASPVRAVPALRAQPRAPPARTRGRRRQGPLRRARWPDVAPKP